MSLCLSGSKLKSAGSWPPLWSRELTALLGHSSWFHGPVCVRSRMEGLLSGEEGLGEGQSEMGGRTRGRGAGIGEGMGNSALVVRGIDAPACQAKPFTLCWSSNIGRAPSLYKVLCPQFPIVGDPTYPRVTAKKLAR